MRALRRASESVRVVGWRHTTGRVLVARDLQAYLRLQCLGVLSRSELAAALRHGGTASELAGRAGLAHVELTTAVLDLAVALRLARRRGDRYRIRGLRGRAVSAGRAPDVEGLAEEAVAYDSPIYAGLVDHLRGVPPRPYDAELGAVVAKVSRVAEPLVGPWLAATVGALDARCALDVGCGSGVNLRWLARGLPRGSRVQGIERDADAVALAQAEVAGTGIAVARADLAALPRDLRGPWDVVLLAQNLYYWPPPERSGLLAQVGELAGSQGTVIAITAVPGRLAFGRHLDLALRVTEGCSRLPTPAEMLEDARAAGFTDVRVEQLAPGMGLAALVASGWRATGGTDPVTR